jgi:beta-N-acetylhexosaminidase
MYTDDRRSFLKKLVALGVAVPFAGAFERIQAALAGPTDSMPVAKTRAMSAPVAQLQAAMASRQIAGQRVIYSYAGLTVPQSLLQSIAAGEVGGVIFFTDNIASEAQIA